MKVFNLTKEQITLTQFLKAVDLISSGGEAKYYLKEYIVHVNGIVTTERSKKLKDNDIVTIGNDSYILKYD